MRFLIVVFISFLLSNIVFAQPAGYYNGTSGKSGDELKSLLNDIISNHVDFSYSQARYIINYSDADPDNPNNVILFYTQRSQDATAYGTGGDFINREHVWAKSHGDFAGIRPMDGDAHNLRPADASVNEDRSNKDFRDVKPNGYQHTEASECWYNNDYWEPGPATKGQVARIIFYMATRYEGENDERDLEPIKGTTSSSLPQHGDLNSLLQWNRLYPPSDFERRRNERIFTVQQNRNPFVDNPKFADLIWDNFSPDVLLIDSLDMIPVFPKPGDKVTITATVECIEEIENVTINWGKSLGIETNQILMTNLGNKYSAILNLENFNSGDILYFTISAATSSFNNSINGSIELCRDIKIEDIANIGEVQGSTDISPMNDKIITIAGRINANFDNSFYLQQGDDPNSGICVFGTLKTGHVGDSVVVTGKVVEYNNLTELSEVGYCYNFKNNQEVEPIEITASEVGEKYEGMLVKIKNVVFTQGGLTVPDENTSYIFSDSTGSLTLFSRFGSRLVGKKIPKGITDVTGVVSQYQNTYQILARDINDFSAGDDKEGPVIVNVSLLDKEWITIEFDEIIDKTTSEQISNYNFSDGISIIAAYRYEEGNTVILQVANMSKGDHTLTINGISDVSGNIIDNAVFVFNSTFSSVNELANNVFKIYFNSDCNEIFVESQNIIRQIQVFEITGRCIYREGFKDKVVSLKINSGKGVYFLRIEESSGKVNNKKIVIR